jgi:hypothetical protein
MYSARRALGNEKARSLIAPLEGIQMSAAPRAMRCDVSSGLSGRVGTDVPDDHRR